MYNLVCSTDSLPFSKIIAFGFIFIASHFVEKYVEKKTCMDYLFGKKRSDLFLEDIFDCRCLPNVVLL